MSSRSWACPLCAGLGVVALALLAWVWIGRGDDLASQVRQRSEADGARILSAAGFPWARLKIEDEVGHIEGTAPSLAERAAAFAAAGSLLMPMMGSPGVFARLQDAQTAPLPSLPALADTAASAPSRASAARGEASTPLTAADCSAELASLLRAEALHFRLGSADFAPQSAELIQRLQRTARRCPEARFRVEGHTDAQGDAAGNQRLSERRAQAVVQALVRAGVPAHRLRAQGLGESRPLDTADTPAAHERNRRIEIHLMDRPG